MASIVGLDGKPVAAPQELTGKLTSIKAVVAQCVCGNKLYWSAPPVLAYWQRADGEVAIDGQCLKCGAPIRVTRAPKGGRHGRA